MEMTITEEMIAEDEYRWHDRNIAIELGYCGYHMPDRKNITNDDIRFYAYVMRKAHAMLLRNKPLPMFEVEDDDLYAWSPKDVEYFCPNKECGRKLMSDYKFCPYCGQAVKLK